jgi:hypothetical protein
MDGVFMSTMPLCLEVERTGIPHGSGAISSTLPREREGNTDGDVIDLGGVANHDIARPELSF